MEKIGNLLHKFIHDGGWVTLLIFAVIGIQLEVVLNEGKRIIGLSSPEFKRVGEQALVSSMNLEKHVGY